MSDPAAGRSLELYYIDGRPDGMLTAEMFNWTGHVLVVPRTQLVSALGRPETGCAGVYLLLGEREGEPLVYIGESEDIGGRIKSHDTSKDWWNLAVLVTTAGNKLNKAHGRYIEARLIEQARAVGRSPLENGTSPARPPLSEADVAKMEAFLENLFIVLPAVRVDMFIRRSRPSGRATPAADISSAARAPVSAQSPCFEMSVRKHAISAHAVVQDGEFVVQKGSRARLSWEGREVSRSSYAELHEELRRSGILQPEGDHCVFAENYAFTAPSAAGAVVAGRQTNGAVEWRTREGVTYKDWEAQQLAKSRPAGL